MKDYDLFINNIENTKLKECLSLLFIQEKEKIENKNAVDIELVNRLHDMLLEINLTNMDISLESLIIIANARIKLFNDIYDYIDLTYNMRQYTNSYLLISIDMHSINKLRDIKIKLSCMQDDIIDLKKVNKNSLINLKLKK